MIHANQWLERSHADDESASVVNRLLALGYPYLLPRIPGIDDYLQALEEAIPQAISAKLSPEDALSEVVEKWNTLTDYYGRDRQRVAYRRHLGLDEQ